VDGAKAVLVLIVAVDAIQAVLAGIAVLHGSRRRGRGEDGLARYSFGHARLLFAGAVLLAVPAVLGLAGVIGVRTAVWIVIGCEVVGVAAAARLHDRIRPSPGASSATAAPSSATPTE
jgi:hypothetical protein